MLLTVEVTEIYNINRWQQRKDRKDYYTFHLAYKEFCLKTTVCGTGIESCSNGNELHACTMFSPWSSGLYSQPTYHAITMLTKIIWIAVYGT